MSEPQGESPSAAVSERLLLLDEIETNLLELWEAMRKADPQAIFAVDVLATGAVNRALALTAGFRRMICERNLICAASLLRLQIDTALRFYAVFLVEKPHDFAQAVLSGARIDKLTDQAGEMMRDSYLVKRLTPEADWLPRVYKETSGYIHLSSKHLMSTFSPTGEQDLLEIKVGAADKPLPDFMYIEAIDAFLAASKLFGKYLHGWVVTKSYPEAVAKLRAETHAAKAANDPPPAS